MLLETLPVDSTLDRLTYVVLLTPLARAKTAHTINQNRNGRGVEG
jgi:hypothetical protein